MPPTPTDLSLKNSLVMSNYAAKLTLALGLLVVLLTSQAICQQQQTQQQQQQQQPQQQQQQQPQQNQPLTQTGQTAAASSLAQAPVSVPSSLSSSLASGSASGSAPANTNAIIISSNDDKPKQAQEWPMVTVDGSPLANKSTVDVHVPVFFDMVNHADREQGKSKLDLSVLQGLVTVNKDKTRDANGDMTGPVKVTVFGIPVYSGKGTSSYFASSSSPTSSSGASASASAGNSSPQASQENTIETRRGGLASRSEDTASMLTNKVQKVNDKMISSLSDIFERFSTALRRTGSSLASSGVDSAGQLKIEQERANVARVQSQS